MKSNRIFIWAGCIVFVVIQVIMFVMNVPRYESPQVTPVEAGITQQYMRAKVDSLSNKTIETGLEQTLRLTIIDGDDKNQLIEVPYKIAAQNIQFRQVAAGEQVFLSKSIGQNNKPVYSVVDRYRLDGVLILTVIFVLLLVLVAGVKGFTVALSTAFSVLLITLVTIPQIMQGKNVMVVGVLSAIAIGTITLLLHNGWNRRSQIAWGVFAGAVLTAANLAMWTTGFTKLSGLIGDDSTFLRFSQAGSIHFLGLYIVSILIAVAGMLVSTVSAQSAAVEEINKSQPGLTLWELFAKGMKQGRERAFSTLFGLAMIYIGTTFAGFVALFGTSTYPWYLAVNIEKISAEIVSVLTIGIVIILAVPCVIFLMALSLKKGNISRPLLTFPKMRLLTKK